MSVPTIVGTPPYQNKSTGSLTLAGPTCQAGDLVFVFVMCINSESLLTGTGANPPNIAATDSPYTQVPGSPWSDATSNKKLHLFWARATGTSIPAAQTSDPTTLVQYCVIVVRGGLASGTPYEQLTGGIDTAVDATTTIPGITTQGPNRLVIGGVTTNFDGTAPQWSIWQNANLNLNIPNGEQGDQCTNTGSGTVPGGLGAYAGGKLSQGNTGDTTAILANASRNVYCHFAVIPLAPQIIQLASAISEADALYVITPQKTYPPKFIELASAISETDNIYVLKVNPIRRLVNRLVAGLPYGIGAYGTGEYGESYDSEVDNVYALTPIKEIFGALLNTIIETDTLNAITVNPKRRLIGSISETDSIGTVTRRKTKSIGSISETDSIGTVTRRKTKSIGTITETDIPNVITVNPKRRLVNSISETDSIGTVTRSKKKSIGTITEIDALNVIIINPKRRLVNSINETNTIYSISSQTFNPPKIVELSSSITETDICYALKVSPKRRLVNLISETEVIYTIIPRKVKTLETIIETGSISIITHRKSRLIGIFTETNSVSTIAHRKSRVFGTLTETDNIYSFKISPLRRLVHTITETDLLWAISALGQKKINVGLVTETNIVHSIKINPQHRLLNTITESETIHSISSYKKRILGTITEINSFYSITPFGVHYPSTRPGPDYLTLDSGKINELDLDENHNIFLALITRTTSPEFTSRTTSPEFTVRTTYLTFNVNHLTGVIIDENHTGYLVLSGRETSPGLNAPNKELILDG